MLFTVPCYYSSHSALSETKKKHNLLPFVRINQFGRPLINGQHFPKLVNQLTEKGLGMDHLTFEWGEGVDDLVVIE